MLQEALPVCPKDLDPGPPQPSTCPYLPQEKPSRAARAPLRPGRPPQGPNQLSTQARLDSDACQPRGQRAKRAARGRARWVPTLPVPRSSSGQTGEGRQDGATGTAATHDPGGGPKAQVPRDPTIARRTTCTSAGTGGPRPTTPTGALEATGQPCEGGHFNFLNAVNLYNARSLFSAIMIMHE